LERLLDQVVFLERLAKPRRFPMRSRDPGVWMWAEACELLDRAERLHRQFFVPQRAHGQHPVWEPPVDLLETDGELWICVALPGVPKEQLHVLVENGVLIVTGERSMPGRARGTRIHRLEIPYGRFERRIELPAGRFDVVRRDLTDGCLTLGLRKLQT
jgi:HSP20 family molecular chaperone IbpA